MGTFAFTPPTAEQIEALEAQHGRIGIMAHSDDKSWVVVLRKPNGGEYKRFRAQSVDTAQRAMAQERLFTSTCVYPTTPADVQALLDEWPGIPEACGSLLMSLAGMAGNERGK